MCIYSNFDWRSTCQSVSVLWLRACGLWSLGHLRRGPGANNSWHTSWPSYKYVTLLSPPHGCPARCVINIPVKELSVISHLISRIYASLHTNYKPFSPPPQ